MCLVSKAMATDDTDYMQLPYKSYRTGLTNHMGSYIMPLVNNSLRGGHTHNTFLAKSNFINQPVCTCVVQQLPSELWTDFICYFIHMSILLDKQPE